MGRTEDGRGPHSWGGGDERNRASHHSRAHMAQCFINYPIGGIDLKRTYCTA